MDYILQNINILGHDIRVVGIDQPEPIYHYVCGRDVLIALGYSNKDANLRKIIRRVKNKKPLSDLIKDVKGPLRLLKFIHKNGITDLFKSLKKAPVLTVGKEIYMAFGLTFNIVPTKQQVTISTILMVFEGENMKEEYTVSGPEENSSNYRIDLYFKSHKIAVECDERNHTNYNSDKEKRRQQYCKDSLGCTFIRFNPDENGFDIFKELGRIYDKIKLNLSQPLNSSNSEKTCSLVEQCTNSECQNKIFNDKQILSNVDKIKSVFVGDKVIGNYKIKIIDCEKTHKCVKIDLYFISFNIAVQFLEQDSDADQKQQADIEEKLGCKVLSLNKNEDIYKILNRIYREIKLRTQQYENTQNRIQELSVDEGNEDTVCVESESFTDNVVSAIIIVFEDEDLEENYTVPIDDPQLLEEDNYIINVYFKKYKIAVKCCFSNDDIQKKKKQQAYITKCLGCSFVLFNPLGDNKDIYKVLGSIHTLIKEKLTQSDNLENMVRRLTLDES